MELCSVHALRVIGKNGRAATRRAKANRSTQTRPGSHLPHPTTEFEKHRDLALINNPLGYRGYLTNTIVPAYYMSDPKTQWVGSSSVAMVEESFPRETPVLRK